MPDVHVKTGIKGSSRKFTWEEVARHSKRDSMWVSVRGKVYELSSFAQSHPGESYHIRLAAGRDVTQVFEAYHDFGVASVLNKFYIGELETTELPTFPEPSPFFKEVKARVKTHFRTVGHDPSTPPIEMWARYAMILLAFIAGWFGTFCGSPINSFWTRFAWAVWFGFFRAQTGMYLHDGTHLSVTHSPWVWKIFGIIGGDFLNGFSHLHWMYKHVLGHHTYTNVPGVDPDNSVKDPGFRRLSHVQKWLPRYEGQERWAPMMYCFWSTFKRPDEVVEIYIKKKLMSIRVNDLTVSDHVIFWGGKGFFFITQLVLPCIWLGWKAIPLFIITEFAMSYWLTIMIGTNHVATGCDWPEPDPKTNVLPYDWAEHEVRSSLDFAHDSWFWTVFSIGFNFQATHHIFPGINQYYHPIVHEVVKQACKEFEIKYNYKATTYEAILLHIDHLRVMGKKSE
ncbi:delta-5 fatty acid desaturase [Gonapodya prolifera JEL478]|uniref:Delta-5 fatty acid desaturase n=1 Tax=Gonapodya prolifera (strain JEL478) TaxID=1344416 RepID=A0A139ACV0_GONPJ|nr:delta-5 fatty acid desaturase [Gonapodya prolifera JEL478]|eukprot:KXS14275.1 delta-5 fatty acid desaturase [Gonapodya prolifera JEL478]